MRQSPKATLILEDGTRFEGKSFGYDASTAGEVVFNTAMTGYPENLTDPSCEGQILVSTYPILGNYGVAPTGSTNDVSEYFESDHIHCRAIVAQDYSYEHSHWLAVRSLADWLREEKILGIYDVDTRALAKHLRENGSMLGKIVVEGAEDVELYDPNAENLVAKVSCKGVETYGEGEKTVVLVDCGVQHHLIRTLVKSGVKVVRVPWDYDFLQIPYDGLIISNGPGNPEKAKETIENIARAMELGKPIFGISLGHQLLALAAGGKVCKLTRGHRSQNQPVRRVGTTRCFVTTQNHGFAVDASSLSADWETLFVNMNDDTNEGLRHRSKPFFSTQFDPETGSCAKGSESMLDEFIALL